MGFFRAAGTVLRKDLLRRVRSPLAPVSMLLFPVVFSLLIGLAFGSRGLPPIRVAFVDEDGGLLARLLQSAFLQDRMPFRFDLRPMDRTEALRQVEDDKVAAVVTIPAGFTDSLLAGGSSRIEVIKNPAGSIQPQIVETAVAAAAQIGSSALVLFEDPIERIADAAREGGAFNDATAIRISRGISDKVTVVVRTFLPPLIRIEKPTDTGTSRRSGGSPFDIATLILPGMAVFALLMLAMVMMADLQREDVRGTLARQFVSPVRVSAVLAGKMAATGVLCAVCAVVLLAVCLVWAKGRNVFLEFLALSLAFSLSATGFAAFVQSLSRSYKTGAAIGSILVMLMGMVGGGWLPLEMMGDFTRKIAPYTLVYWGSEGYRNLLFRSAGIGDVALHLAVLCGTGLVFFAFAAVRLHGRYGKGA